MPIETDNTADLSSDLALLTPTEEAPIKEKEAPKEKPEVKAPVKKVVEAPESDDEPENDDEVDKVLKELEDSDGEAEEDSKETPEEILPHQRPSLEAIRKEFPDLFKKFPSLKDSFFREKQFSEVFHTPAEAAEAATTAEEYKVLQDDIVNGDGSKLIPALKASDSLSKFASNFLPNLYKTDKDTHWKTILPILEDAVRASFREGKRLNDENLKNASLVLSNFLFSDMEVAEGKKTFVEKEAPKDTKVSEERKVWESERYNSTKIDIEEKLYNQFVKDIHSGFKESEGLTKFMKDSITDKVLAKVRTTMTSDQPYLKFMGRLWNEAKAGGYKESDKTRIYNASLARAKSLIPTIRRQLIAEALGSSPSEQQRVKKVVEERVSRKEPGSGGRVPNGNKAPSAKAIDWKRTTDADFLNGNVKLKRT